MRYRVAGNYGTFEILKFIEADSEDEAWEHTGIMADLEEAGWEFLSPPEGEEWDIEEWPE